MGFLAPWFLGGLAALGLPVWLHLLRQHKTTPKEFSSLMFFERRTQSSIKHRRLKYLLLMMARLLVLLLIVLAFAAPYIRRTGAFGTAGRRLLVIAVDNSFSMRVGDRLSRAKQEAAGVLGSRGPRDAAQILTVGSTVHALTQGTTEGGELRAALESIQQSDARSSYGELARALRSIEQSLKIPLDVHLFSDMQKSSLPPAFTDLRLGQSTKLVLHSVAERNAPNYAVESVVAPRSVFDTKKARVQATVAGYGAPASKRNVLLSINGKVIGTKQADIPENGRTTVEFLGLDANYGFNKAEVKIDSADALASDDAFFFAVERSDPRQVLFVHEGRQQRGLLYYKAALESASEGAFMVEAATSDMVANVSPAKYGFVVLSDAGSLPSTFEEALKTYVRGGGALLIVAGPASAGRPKLPVFDEGVKESRYASRAGERFLVLGSMDITHPVLRATGRWENVKFYQAIKVDPGQSRVLARLADETPLLLEKRVGEGRVLVFTSTVDNISNDFPLHPPFVPFIEQSARYLVGSEVRPSSYAIDSHVELRLEKGVGTVEVLDPKGKRAMDLKQASQARSLLLTQTGFYDVGRANGRHELVAVNADRKESELELAPKDTLDLWQATGSQPAAAGTAEAEQQQNASLWWYILLAAMLLAVFESLLSSRYLSLEPTDG
ncbi:MAG TPA: BatA domain-containing protein [Bryobacteraceae bacterium]|nr:BatA domain-containing protein [Bryobacteraceae bacterium]